MSSIQAMPGRGVGFVRAVFSKKGKGFAAPPDLLRVQLRVANRMSAERHNAAVYARLAEDFGGYLVTDENPSDMTEAEMAACWPFDGPAEFEAFSARRRCHGLGNDAECMTGDMPHGLRREALKLMEWALDAPEFIAAGSMRGVGGLGFALGETVRRGGE